MAYGRYSVVLHQIRCSDHTLGDVSDAMLLDRRVQEQSNFLVPCAVSSTRNQKVSLDVQPVQIRRVTLLTLQTTFYGVTQLMQSLKSLRVAIVAILALTSASAFADNVPANRKIVKIFTYATFAVVQYSPPFANNLGCAGGAAATKAALINLTANANGKVIFASALAAQATGSNVGFGILGCSRLFGNGIPIMYRLDSSS